MNSDQWFAVQTHPHRERQAVLQLANQGYNVFFPRYRKQRRHARRVDVVEAPLFPGYIFVRLNLGLSHWRSVLSTFGVRRMVSAGERPLALPDPVMIEMQSRTDTHGLCTLVELPRYSPGQPLTITEGPFKDYVGLFAEQNDEYRIILLLELLGRSLRLPISAHAVQPLI